MSQSYADVILWLAKNGAAVREVGLFPWSKKEVAVDYHEAITTLVRAVKALQEK